jgi:hypothetical protein
MVKGTIITAAVKIATINLPTIPAIRILSIDAGDLFCPFLELEFASSSYELLFMKLCLRIPRINL